MAKTVFRPGEAKEVKDKVMLPLYKDYSPVEEIEEEVVEEYTGPTADDLRRESEAYKIQWETEKQQMLEAAKAEADEIIKKAENTAFDEVRRQSDQAQIIKADADAQAASIIEKAKAEAAQIIAQAEAERENLKSNAHDEGYQIGKKSGYEEGKAEVERLVERMHKMIDAVMIRREEILQETESQIVELVILMTRKVIKILSENQKNVVMANTLAALKKLKARGQVTLRVNLEDVKLTTAHVDEFIQHVEKVEGITVLEDSSVDQGGCIVETDFGAIDARISSQLNELENKILEISPVKNIKRDDPLVNAE